MVLEFLRVNFPALYGVALFAIRAELAAVNIGVAIGAARADFREDQIRVALRAAHLCVHAEQRVTSAVVVKFRDTADGLPARVCMAIFAGDIYRAMWIPTGFLLGKDNICPEAHENQKEEERLRDQFERAHGTQYQIEFRGPAGYDYEKTTVAFRATQLYRRSELVQYFRCSTPMPIANPTSNAEWSPGSAVSPREVSAMEPSLRKSMREVAWETGRILE